MDEHFVVIVLSFIRFIPFLFITLILQIVFGTIECIHRCANLCFKNQIENVCQWQTVLAIFNIWTQPMCSTFPFVERDDVVIIIFYFNFTSLSIHVEKSRLKYLQFLFFFTVKHQTEILRKQAVKICSKLRCGHTFVRTNMLSVNIPQTL